MSVIFHVLLFLIICHYRVLSVYSVYLSVNISNYNSAILLSTVRRMDKLEGNDNDKIESNDVGTVLKGDANMDCSSGGEADSESI